MLSTRNMLIVVVAAGMLLITTRCDAFTTTPRVVVINRQQKSFLHMEQQQQQSTTSTSDDLDMIDPMEEATMDSELVKQLEKQKRAQLLREQEVFMQKSTGIYKCSNCEWEYDETKGDVMMIGGMIQPNTKFESLPSNYRCPVCRASKDNFVEVVEEIPGFAVNQGYGFGTNGWSASQKNLAIFGGLAAFFILFISGYAMT
jgi:rubredoxin